MSSQLRILDHTGAPAKHGFVRVNGFRVHYVTAGTKGPVVCLIHGIPKTVSYVRTYPLAIPVRRQTKKGIELTPPRSPSFPRLTR